MKFQNIAAFEKHLREAAPSHLSRVYLVLGPLEYDRSKIVQKIVSYFKTETNSSFYKAGKDSVAAVLDALNTCPFFGGSHVVVFEGIEALGKEEIERLSSYLANPSPFAFLILSGGNSKGLSELYTKGKKEVVALDLADEKPWDRERRLKEWIVSEVIKEGKTFSPEALAALYEHIGPDLPALEQELLKLFCYLGEKNRIELIDVEIISLPRAVKTGWQIAESIVWHGKRESCSLDLATLLALIGQVRHYMQIGERIARLYSEGRSKEQIGSQFPEIRPQAFDRYYQATRQKPQTYFQKGLEALFDLELSAKSSSFSPNLLWDIFTARFIYATLTAS